MNYELLARILRRGCSDDVKDLISLYQQEEARAYKLTRKLEEQASLISILEAENKILKEEANKHDY